MQLLSFIARTRQFKLGTSASLIKAQQNISTVTYFEYHVLWAWALSQSHESQSLDRMLDWKQQLATPGCGALVYYKEKPNSPTVKSTVTPTTGSKKNPTTLHRPKPKESNGRRKKSQPSPPNRLFSSKILWGAKNKFEHWTVVQTVLLCTDLPVSKVKCLLESFYNANKAYVGFC